MIVEDLKQQGSNLFPSKEGAIALGAPTYK